MRYMTLLLFVQVFISNGYSQDSYETDSGITYKIGDTLRIGSPLSHLGWKSIFSKKTKEVYMSNKNLIKKDVFVVYIDTLEKPETIKFIYKKKTFTVNINDALRNKEIIPPLKRELINNGLSDNYKLLKQLKELLDMEAITKGEYEIEKKKILESN